MALNVKPGKKAPVGFIKYLIISVAPPKTAPVTGPNIRPIIELQRNENPTLIVGVTCTDSVPSNTESAINSAHIEMFLMLFSSLRELFNVLVKFFIKKPPSCSRCYN